MEHLILLFIRRALADISSRLPLTNEPTLTGVIVTPMGKVAGIRQSQLEVIQMPYMSESGKVGEVPMKRLYLEQVLDKLAADLQMDVTTLMDGSRELVIVADLHASSQDGCCPCYYGSTRNPVNMENLRRLESMTMRCLSEGLDCLPPDILYKWTNVVLNPIFEQARTVISGKDTG
jgi:hypothetical protein